MKPRQNNASKLRKGQLGSNDLVILNPQQLCDK